MRFTIDCLKEPMAPPILVDVERWWDARNVALQHFGCEVSQLEFGKADGCDDRLVDVWTRWVGVDGGSDPRNVRRMQWRSEGDEWREMTDYVAW